MITSREATNDEDLQAGLSLLKSFLSEQRSTPEPYLADWEELDEFSKGFYEGTHRLFLIEEEGQLLAAGWLLGDKLDEAYVKPEHRGRGIQQHLISVRVAAGGRQTEVRKTNKASNRNFEKAGWLSHPHKRENYILWRLPEA